MEYGSAKISSSTVNVSNVRKSSLSASEIFSGSNQPAALNSPTQDQSTSTTSATFLFPVAAVASFSRISSQPTSDTSTSIPVSFVNSSSWSSDGIAQSGAINVMDSPLSDFVSLLPESFFDPQPTAIDATIAATNNMLTIFFFISCFPPVFS